MDEMYCSYQADGNFWCIEIVRGYYSHGCWNYKGIINVYDQYQFTIGTRMGEITKDDVHKLIEDPGHIMAIFERWE